MLKRLAWIAAIWLLLPLSARAGVILTAELHGALSPASVPYIARTLAEARSQQAELVVIGIDSPGEASPAARQIIAAIGASPVPVAVFVAHAGARTAGGGLLHAGQIAAVTPEARIDSIGQPMLDAVTTRAVETAANVPELLQRIDGRVVRLASGEERVLALAGAAIVAVERSGEERLLSLAADPNIALLMLLVGGFALICKLYVPSMPLPGRIAAPSLLLAVIGLALLPLDFAGVLLIGLSIALLTFETRRPRRGVFGLCGIAAFVAGALLLIDAEGLAMAWKFIIPFALIRGLTLAGIGAVAWRASRRDSTDTPI